MKHSCSGRVYGGMWNSFGCSSPATREYEGKWWCFHHDPREKEKNRKARDEKYKLEQEAGDKKKDMADKLLKRLGVKGSIEYLWKGGCAEAIVIRFDEVEKLLKELGR